MLSDRASSHDDLPPSLSEFETWPPDRMQSLVRDKTVIFSPGGSSRWYFLEHGDASKGYTGAEEFQDYASRAFDRILELVDMMFSDGVRTVLVIGTTPRQSSRDEEYNRHLAWASGLLVDDATRALYARYQMGVLFRGGWRRYFEQVGAPELLEPCQELERATAPQHERWLIWVTEDDPIPASLAPLLSEALATTGRLPDRAALCRAYYGRPLEHADIFISSNKPTVEGQLPPLMTVGDLYFTVNLSYYLDRPQWRGILYDHLFARRARYRDYTAIAPEAMAELREFYRSNQGVTLGVGTHHAPTQTWRPLLPPSG